VRYSEKGFVWVACQLINISGVGVKDRVGLEQWFSNGVLLHMIVSGVPPVIHFVDI